MKRQKNWIVINYFKEEEFYSPDTMQEDMDFKFILLLDSLRYKVGFPIIINSGYRSPAYNKLIGGVDDSSHCIGLAADISCTDNIQRLAIIKCAIELGITRIGIGKDFVHIDVDKSKTSCIWIY